MSAASRMPRTARRLPSPHPDILLPLLPQDPGSTPDPVRVRVRGPLLAGPIGDRVAVFDYNRDKDVVFPRATPRRNGTFPDYEVRDPRFHQLNCYAITARATELVEYELGRPLRWGFDGSRLLVLPHAGFMANAFYSAATHSLQLYSFVHEGKHVYHTALAHDIVAHETGHALLDAVRPRYCDAVEPETSAVHEAVGDLTAVFAALSHDVVSRRVAGRLRTANLLSEIAEGFEDVGVNGWSSLRSLVNAKPDDWADVYEPHDRSLKLSSAVYSALVAVEVAIRRRGAKPRDSLGAARIVLQRMAVRALDFLPPADATLDDFALAMLAADAAAVPADTDGYRAIVTQVLRDRRLVTPASLRRLGPDPRPWRSRPRSWPGLSPRDAYLFLDANRDRLALAPQAAERDFVVRDVQTKHHPGYPGAVQQVVLVYEYPVDVELKGSAYAGIEERWLTLRGGGTLVFDADGGLLHHAEKPVTRERVARALEFVRRGEGRFLTVVGQGLDDELRRASARRPWLLERSEGRLLVRTNFAAACGRGRARTGGRG